MSHLDGSYPDGIYATVEIVNDRSLMTHVRAIYATRFWRPIADDHWVCESPVFTAPGRLIADSDSAAYKFAVDQIRDSVSLAEQEMAEAKAEYAKAKERYEHWTGDRIT